LSQAEPVSLDPGAGKQKPLPMAAGFPTGSAKSVAAGLSGRGL